MKLDELILHLERIQSRIGSSIGIKEIQELKDIKNSKYSEINLDKDWIFQNSVNEVLSVLK